MPKRKNGELTHIDRVAIEQGIMNKETMRGIARRIDVHCSTVIREIRRNGVKESPHYLAVHTRNICKKAADCKQVDLCNKGCLIPCHKCKQWLCNDKCPDFDPEPCPYLDKSPFCCNICPYRYGYGCNYSYHFYDANLAGQLAKQRKIESRIGIDITEQQLAEIERIIKPLIKQGQSLEHIWATHGDELPCTSRTMRNYIKIGKSSILNIDLVKVVKYKPRDKDADKTRPDPEIFIGRTFKDYLELPIEERARAVQMDCVVGKQGEKQAILTLTFPATNLQLLFYLETKDQAHVRMALNTVEEVLGYDSFKEVFGIILTDRGTEFEAPDKIEISKNGKQRCSVYYCDPQRSDEKGCCERTHADLRRIIPKSTSLIRFEATDMSIIASNLNSYLRPKLGFVSPIAASKGTVPRKLLDALSIAHLDPDRVVMDPSLISDILER